MRKFGPLQIFVASQNTFGRTYASGVGARYYGTIAKCQ